MELPVIMFMSISFLEWPDPQSWHLRPLHRTLASSEWWQSWILKSEIQSSKALSVPLHLTSSIQIGPLPAPNLAPLRATWPEPVKKNFLDKTNKNIRLLKLIWLYAPYPGLYYTTQFSAHTHTPTPPQMNKQTNNQQSNRCSKQTKQNKTKKKTILWQYTPVKSCSFYRILAISYTWCIVNAFHHHI